jgi:hypothetical protein
MGDIIIPYGSKILRRLLRRASIMMLRFYGVAEECRQIYGHVCIIETVNKEREGFYEG